MKKEIKICLPLNKTAYALCFIVILSLVRRVSYTSEVGIALEPPLAVLSLAFVSDTYVQEITGGRSEVWHLYSRKKRELAVFRRMLVQELYLLFLSVTGYGSFFLFQRPAAIYGGQQWDENMLRKESGAFFLYLAAIIVTLVFWGMLSLVLSCLFRNLWMGIGGGMALWIMTNSQAGDRFLGKWNLFSYSFSDIETRTDISWLCGKLVCAALCVVMILIFPMIIKKRG